MSIFLRRFLPVLIAIIVLVISFMAFFLRDQAGATSIAWTTGSQIDDLQLSYGNTCATSDGKAYCWGSNVGGELGDGGSMNPSLYSRPVDTTGVLLNKSISDISVAENARGTCVITEGKAYCWGWNEYYRLGTNAIARDAISYVPIKVNDTGVLAGKVVSKIDVGYYATCAIADGKAYCWGENQDGMLGDGTNNDSAVPVAVNSSGPLAGKTVTDIKVGSLNVCAIADGQVYCWGNNYNGILGDGTLDNSTVPVAVSASSNLSDRVATKIISGLYSHMCVMTDTTPYCWGNNGNGELGRGSTPGDPTIPQAIDTAGALSGKTITLLDVGNGSTCAIADNKAYCWGVNTYGQAGIGLPPPDGPAPFSVNTPTAVDTSGVLSGKSVTDLAVSNSIGACVIADGKAYCWGDSYSGMRGDGELTGNIGVPVAVYAGGDLVGKTLTKIASGTYNNCAVSTSNEVFCWGDNTQGQLGNGSTTMTGLPTVVLDEPLELDSLSVSSMGYPYQSGQSTTIYGQGFLYGATVTFDGEPVDVLSNNLDGAIEVDIPPGDPGVVDITVTNPDGSSATLSGAFTYDDEPMMTINSISPNTAFTNTSGGTAVISVTNFVVGGSVKIGGVNATISSESSSSITIEIPTSSTSGPVDVLVTNPSGQVATLTNGFTYTVVQPKVITGVTFSTVDGKKILTVSGTGLVGETNSAEYAEGVQRSLVKLNTVDLPFCTDGTNQPLSFFVVDAGVPAALVSDSPPCYYLFNDSFAPIIGKTHAAILLPNNFDIAAQGTISVNNSPVFTFNEPAPSQSPPPSTPQNTPTQPDTSPAEEAPVVEEAIFKVDDESVTGTPEISDMPTFTGYADPFSTVTVTIHSDPVICTTTADSTGYWSCTFSSELPPGKHTAYIKVVTTDNKTTEYGPYDVIVKADEAPPVITSETDLKNDIAEATSFPWAWVLGAAALTVIIIGIIIANRRRKQA